MTLYASGNRYICVPASLEHMGDDFTGMSGKEFVLLIWLARQADRYSNRRRYTNRDIATAVDIHENRVRWLRVRLERRKLLRTDKEADGTYYVLLNPSTGRPVDEPVKDEDADNWGRESPIGFDVKEEPVAALIETARTVEELKAVYKNYGEPSREENEINLLLQGCRKDPQRTAELKEKRAALQALRKEARESARLDYESAMTNL